MTAVDHYLVWGFVFLFILIVATMQWFGKLPSIRSVEDLAQVLNSRGGNILVLAIFSFIFFITAIRFTYWVIGHSIDGKLTVENSVAMAAFTWITGSAFGGAFTSMVKAMTGSDSKARSTDMTNGTGSSTDATPKP